MNFVFYEIVHPGSNESFKTFRSILSADQPVRVQARCSVVIADGVEMLDFTVETRDRGFRTEVDKSAPEFEARVIDNAELRCGALLGKGGYGKVSLGFWKGAMVAVKEMREADPEMHMSRSHDRAALREFRVLAALRHPNLVSCYGFTTNPFRVVLEVAPMSLARLLNTPRFVPLDGPDFWKILFDIGAGMEYLHSCNLGWDSALN